jgi:hypothetical protein
MPQKILLKRRLKQNKKQRKKEGNLLSNLLSRREIEEEWILMKQIFHTRAISKKALPLNLIKDNKK